MRRVERAMIAKASVSCFLIFTVSVSAQPGLPRFGQYTVAVEKPRVKQINFKRNPDARIYRTRLSHALDAGVNFAGHYVIAGWGCGTGCTNSAIIDVRSGNVIWPEQFYNIDATYGDGYSDRQLDFRRNSRLLIIRGRPGSKDGDTVKPSGDHYYEWRNNRLRLIRSVVKTTN